MSGHQSLDEGAPGIDDADWGNIRRFHESDSADQEDLAATRKPPVTMFDCAMARAAIYVGVPATHVAERLDIASSTIRRHIRGDCRHDHHVTPLRYERGGWTADTAGGESR